MINVITDNNILVIGPEDSIDRDIFLPMDGTKSSIKDFQKWANTNGYSPKLKVSGSMDAETQKAYAKMGANYEKFVASQKEAKSQKSAANKQKAGEVGKKIFEGAKSIGLFDALLGKLGLGPAQDSGGGTPPVSNEGGGGIPPSGDKPSGGMDKTTKIVLISVAAVAAIGITVALVKRKGK